MKNSDPTQLSQEIGDPDTLEVGMKDWAPSSPEHPILATKGLGPCIGIAAFNPTTQTGHLAHIANALFEGESLDQMLASVVADATNPQDVKIWVRGGQRSSEMTDTFDMPQLSRDIVLEKLRQLNLPDGNVDIAWDETAMGSQGTRVVLDTRTGSFESVPVLAEQDAQKLGGIAINGL